MSRNEADREDLFAEATALTTRIELQSSDEQQPITAGCRPTGAWSIYFGGDPCYHFDPAGGLRRAFVDGLLYRTQGNTLAQLDRVRTEHTVELQRVDLADCDRAGFLDTMQQRLQRLHFAVASSSATILRQHPATIDVSSLLAAALQHILNAKPRLAPAISTRKD